MDQIILTQETKKIGRYNYTEKISLKNNDKYIFYGNHSVAMSLSISTKNGLPIYGDLNIDNPPRCLSIHQLGDCSVLIKNITSKETILEIYNENTKKRRETLGLLQKILK